ncbi:PREDICTED: neurexin-3-like, partial [Priapulus caudatus]|uniref:Neurexin-3-like n=1 Tax=Priapulus caudatus TaxID=37621 RepID=A0ABM1F011_PRICU
MTLTSSSSSPCPPLVVVVVVVMATACALARGFVLEGSPSSYARFPRWPSAADADASLTFEFRTDQSDGLLMYTDDGGQTDFFELKLLGGAARLRMNLGGGAIALRAGSDLNDFAWHLVEVRRRGALTSLVVDDAPPRSAVVAAVDDGAFGNATTNSDVFFGGLPRFYHQRLSSLALPSVVFEPHYRGHVRNVVYVTAGGEGTTVRPRMIDSVGLRYNEVDKCEVENLCQHGGLCISTDTGAICSCSFVDYEGEFCET